ncbi:DUF6414 family protein [Glycomyces terrestris]|uniref:Uncharacterized protein n=1 Tax=Glycomyces terrestris TaxID=2493553 RepID=A0A426UYT4_9ACTN|nr:hypothetical protein [Glycomyces terrestris]RRR99726.1 hypothetical protein EIW28_13695 [Glycomyces terrestris]
MATASTSEHDDELPEAAHEFAYIDAARTQSLLAYLFDGLPNAVQTVRNSGKFKLGLRYIASAEYEARSGQESETRSQDLDSLHYQVLELALESVGFLRDITDELTGAEVWNTTIQELAPPGKLIRVTGPTTMIDYRKVLQSFQKIYPYFNSDSSSKKGPRPKSLADKFASGDTLTIIAALEELSPEGVSIRIEPHGSDLPNCGFVGTLDPRYFRDDGGSFAIRHGYKPQLWTTVAYISRYADTDVADVTAISDPIQNLYTGERIDRGALAKIVQGVGNYMGDFGMTEAPTAPGGAITPIAVYKHITKYEVE